MKKLISTLLTIIFISSSIHSSEPSLSSLPPQPVQQLEEEESSPFDSFQFLCDRHFSPHAGGENLLSLHRGLERLEERSPLKDQRGFLPGLARASELILGWMPINYLTMVVQHEVFGHGYRVRDLGKGVASVSKYSFNVPPPFGPGGAATYFIFKTMPSPTQSAVIAAGGVEATGILAHQLRMQWLDTGILPAQEASLYSFSQHDISHYISSLHTSDPLFGENTGHDIKSYLNFLHLSYPAGSLSIKELKRMSKIGYFDPFTYLASYSWIKHIITGQEIAIPMFTFGPVAYLPSARLTLSPFGPQYTLDNYFKYHDVPTYVYVKEGRFAENSFWGIGLFNASLFSHKAHAFGVRLDVWHQPKILNFKTWEKAFTGFLQKEIPDLFSEEELRHTPSMKPMRTLRFGGAGALIYNYAFFPDRLAMHIELGYKSSGYLSGESLREGLLARLAVQARF